jgi:hypothetical protein
MSIHASLAVLVLEIVLAADPAYAQTNAVKLDAITQLKCAFPISVAASWQNGEPQAQVRKAAVLTFQIDEIDVQEATARFVPLASAPEHIVARLSGANLYFLDIRPTGSLSVTTVFAQESRAGKLKAVYMRTDFLSVSVPGFVEAPAAAQYYGECEAVY